MGFDQNITYRVNLDDSNFNSRLSQMRANMDASLGGGLSSGGFSGPMMNNMMSTMYGGAGGYGGMSDFGSQIRPVTYMPPAIASTPHFGMFQVHQTLAQAGLSSLGPWGMGAAGFMSGGLSSRGFVPENISMSEYMAMSARGFGDRLGDAAAIGGLTAFSTGGQILAGMAGNAIGASMFTGGLMKTLGGMAGMSIATLPITMAVGGITDSMADNRHIQNALAAGSFRFFNHGSENDPLTGRGMNRSTRHSVANAIQNMEANDLRYGMDDYKQVLEGGMQLDLFSGTRDATDFKGKFKGLVESLKTVTTTLHTSLKEGLEVIRGFRDMGVTDPGEVARLTMGSEMRGRASGRTGQEMLAVGQTGAELFRGTGIEMSKGFELNQMNVGTIRTMFNAGTLTRESIAQAGGENAMAQQMTGGALASFQTSYGRAALMANYNASTNSLNPNMVSDMSGRDLMGQISRASNMGPGGLLKFQANQEELISKMSPAEMANFGLATDIGMARELNHLGGVDMETGIRVAAQRRGLSKPLIDQEMGLLKTDPREFAESQRTAISAMRVQAGVENNRNRLNVVKKVENFFGRVYNAAARQFTQASEEIGESWENASLHLAGQAVVTNTGMSSQIALDTANKLLFNYSGSVRGVDTSSGQGVLGMFGYGQSGSGLANEILKGKVNDDGSIDYKGGKAMTFASKEEALNAGYNVIGSGGRGYLGITSSEEAKMIQESRRWQTTKDDKDASEKVKLDEKTLGAMYDLGDKASLATVIGAVFSGEEASVGVDLLGGMSDADFKKKHGGHTRGSYLAKVDKYLTAAGGSTAREERKKQQGTSEMSDESGLSFAEHLGRAADKNHALISSLGLKTSDSAIGAILEKNPAAVALLTDDTVSDRDAFIALTGDAYKGLGIDSTKISSLIENHKKMRGSEQSQKNTIAAKQMMAEVRAGQDSGHASQGGKSNEALSGKTIGDITVDQQQAIELAAQQTMTTVKLIESIQNNIKANMGK